MGNNEHTEHPLDAVKRRQALILHEREKGVGEVGIFWFFREKLFASTVPYTLGEPYGECVNGPDDHVTYWPRLQKSFGRLLPELLQFEYDQVPRGRVICQEADDTFVIYGSEEFVRDDVRKKRIIEEFHLKGKRVLFRADEHYGWVIGMLEDG